MSINYQNCATCFKEFTAVKYTFDKTYDIWQVTFP